MSIKKRRKKNWGDLLTKDLPSLEAVFCWFCMLSCWRFIFRSAELSSGGTWFCCTDSGTWDALHPFSRSAFKIGKIIWQFHGTGQPAQFMMDQPGQFMMDHLPIYDKSASKVYDRSAHTVCDRLPHIPHKGHNRWCNQPHCVDAVCLCQSLLHYPWVCDDCLSVHLI